MLGERDTRGVTIGTRAQDVSAHNASPMHPMSFHAPSPIAVDAACWSAAPAPSLRPVPTTCCASCGCCMAVGQDGGSTAIQLEGEAEPRSRPGNSLHAAFPPATTPGVGSAHGLESVAPGLRMSRSQEIRPWAIPRGCLQHG